MAKPKTKEVKTRQPKNYARYYNAAKDTSEHYFPAVTNTISNFSKTIRDVDNWVKTSTPFKKNPQGTAGEKKIFAVGEGILRAAGTDIKEGNILSFKNLNDKINDLFNGMREKSFDDSYDAEYDSGESYDSSSYGGFDSELYVQGTAVAAEATIDAVATATESITGAQLRASDYSSRRIVAGTNIAISRVLKFQAMNADIMNTINQNMNTLVESANKQDAFQQQALSFYERTENYFNDILEVMREQADPAAARKAENDKYRSRDRKGNRFLENGFDPGAFVKGIWDDSMLGFLGKMVIGTIAPYAAFLGLDLSKLAEGGLGGMGGFEGIRPVRMLFEKTPLAKQLHKLNEDFEDNLKLLFHRLGQGEFGGVLGEISNLGLLGDYKLGKSGGIDLSNYDKGVTKITGKTLKTIETAIPTYLSNIENDIATLVEGFTTGQFEIGTFQSKTRRTAAEREANKQYFEEMRSRKHRNVYDLNEGKFRNLDEFEHDFQEDYNQVFSSAFGPVMDKVSLILSTKSKEEQKAVNEILNQMFEEYGNDTRIRASKGARDNFINTLKFIGVDRTKFADEAAMEHALEDLYNQFVLAQDRFQQARADFFESAVSDSNVYENLFNTSKDKWKDADNFKAKKDIQRTNTIDYRRVKGANSRSWDGKEYKYEFTKDYREKLKDKEDSLDWSSKGENASVDRKQYEDYKNLMDLYDDYKNPQNSPEDLKAKQKAYKKAAWKYKNTWKEEAPQLNEYDEWLGHYATNDKMSFMFGLWQPEMASGHQVTYANHAMQKVVWGGNVADNVEGYYDDDSHKNYMERYKKATAGINPTGSTPTLASGSSSGTSNIQTTEQTASESDNPNTQPTDQTPANANLSGNTRTKFNVRVVKSNGIRKFVDGSASSTAPDGEQTSGDSNAATAPTEDEGQNSQENGSEFTTSAPKTAGDETSDPNAAAKEVRVKGDVGVGQYMKAFANDKIKGAKSWMTQKKEVLMELLSNSRILAGNAENQRIRFFGAGGVFDRIKMMISKFNVVKKFLLGEKDPKTGYYSGGLIPPQYANKLVDAKKAAKNYISGTEYTDYNGQFHAAKEDYLLKPVQEAAYEMHKNMLISKYGVDFEHNKDYQNAANFIKLKDSAHKELHLPHAWTGDVDSNNIAIDTYDYSKFNPTPHSKAKLIGWRWNETDTIWEFHYQYNDEEKTQLPTDEWKQACRLSNVLPDVTPTEIVINIINRLPSPKEADLNDLHDRLKAGPVKVKGLKLKDYKAENSAQAPESVPDENSEKPADGENNKEESSEGGSVSSAQASEKPVTDITADDLSEIINAALSNDDAEQIAAENEEGDEPDSVTDEQFSSYEEMVDESFAAILDKLDVIISRMYGGADPEDILEVANANRNDDSSSSYQDADSPDDGEYSEEESSSSGGATPNENPVDDDDDDQQAQGGVNLGDVTSSDPHSSDGSQPSSPPPAPQQKPSSVTQQAQDDSGDNDSQSSDGNQPPPPAAQQKPSGVAQQAQGGVNLGDVTSSDPHSSDGSQPSSPPPAPQQKPSSDSIQSSSGEPDSSGAPSSGDAQDQSGGKKKRKIKLAPRNKASVDTTDQSKSAGKANSQYLPDDFDASQYSESTNYFYHNGKKAVRKTYTSQDSSRNFSYYQNDDGSLGEYIGEDAEADLRSPDYHDMQLEALNAGEGEAHPHLKGAARGIGKLGAFWIGPNPKKKIAAIAIGAALGGGPVGALAGFLVSTAGEKFLQRSEAEGKKFFKFGSGKKSIFGSLSNPNSKHPILSGIGGVLKAIPNLAMTIGGTVAGLILGGPVGGAIGFTLGHSTFRTGGLHDVLFGGGKKSDNKFSLPKLFGTTVKGIFGIGKSAVGGAFKGLMGARKVLNDNTKDAGTLLPAIGTLGGLAIGGIPGAIIGRSGMKIVGQLGHSIFGGGNQENVGNGEGVEDTSIKPAPMLPPPEEPENAYEFVGKGPIDDPYDPERGIETVEDQTAEMIEGFDQIIARLDSFGFGVNGSIPSRSIPKHASSDETAVGDFKYKGEVPSYLNPADAPAHIQPGYDAEDIDSDYDQLDAEELDENFEENIEAIEDQTTDIVAAIDAGIDRVIAHMDLMDKMGIRRKEKEAHDAKEMEETLWAQSAGKDKGEVSSYAQPDYDADKEPEKKTSIFDTLKNLFSGGGLLDILKVALPVGGAVWLLSSFFKTDVGKSLKEKGASILEGIGNIVGSAKDLLINIANGANQALGWVDDATKKGISLGALGTFQTDLSTKNVDGTDKSNFIMKAAGIQTDSYRDETTGEVVTTHSFDINKVDDDLVKGVVTGGAQKTIWGILEIFSKKLPSFLKQAGAKMKNIGQWAAARIAEEVEKKIGPMVSKSNQALSKFVQKNLPNISAKLSEIHISPEALSTIALGTYGAVKGMSNYGVSELFGIDSGFADWAMRAVSALLEAVCWATTFGAVVDFVLWLLRAATGIDLKKLLATWIYGVLKRDDPTAVNKLQFAQTDFQNRLSMYNTMLDSVGAETLSEEDFTKETEISFWDKVYSTTHFGKKSQHEKEVEATRNMLNAQEVAAMQKESQYQNMSVENITAQENEGYGTARSVGYGTSDSTHYSQLDGTWRNLTFGKMLNGRNTTIGSGGCGPTALATVARSITGNKQITPSTVANMAQDYGYTANGGSAASLFTEGASRLGLASQRVRTSDVPSALASGQKLIISGKKSGGGKSLYTNAGHIVSVSGIKNGKAIVDDPLKSRTETMDIRDVMKGAKKAWAIGTPGSSVGYGTLDDYISNMESMGYGFDENGKLIDFALGDDKYKAWHDGKSFGDLVNISGGEDGIGIFFQQGGWGAGYSTDSAKSWANMAFGNTTYEAAGCFPTAFASALSNVTRTDIDPPLVIKKFGNNWSGSLYNWTAYEDMLKLLYGDTGALAMEDQLLDAGYTSSHRNSGKPWIPSGYNSMSNEDQINEAMKRVTKTLMGGGSVWVDAFGNAGNTNVFTSSHEGGHAISLYGYDQGEGQEPGTLWDNYEGDALTTEFDPGRSMSSEQAIRRLPLSKLRADIVNGRIRRITTFPKPNKSTNQLVMEVQDAMSDFASSYSVRSGSGGSIMSTATDSTSGGASANSSSSTPTDAAPESTSSLANDYGGYQYADQLSDDKTFFGKLGNFMSILNGIASNIWNSIGGEKYQSVFGHFTASGGSGTYQNDLNTVAGVSHTPRYITVKHNRLKEGAFLDIGNLDMSNDEILTSVAEDVTKYWVERWREKNPTLPSYDEDREKWAPTLQFYKDEIYKSWKNQEFVDGRYYKVTGPSGDPILVPAWYSKENAINYMKEQQPLEDVADRIRKYHPNLTTDEEVSEYYDKVMNQAYNKDAEGRDLYGGSHGVDLYDITGAHYSENDVNTGNVTIGGEAIEGMDSNGDNDNDFAENNNIISVGQGDLKGVGMDLRFLTVDDKDYDSSKLINGLTKDQLQNAPIITPTLLQGSYASDAASAGMDWDVKVPNGNPLEYAQTGYKMSIVPDGSYDYIDDPGVGFAGDTAKSKLSNAYGPVSIPEGWSSVEKISADKFDPGIDKHTLFRDVRKFPPINATRMNELISNLTSSSVYQGQGQTFIDASNISGIDPRFLLVQSGIESGWGSSALAKDKGNYFGITAYDGSAYSSGTNFAKDGKADFRTGILNGAQWISRNHINRTDKWIPKASPALLGWDDGHIYGVGVAANGIPRRTAYGQGIAKILKLTEGYGNDTQMEAEGYGNPFMNAITNYDDGADLTQDASFNRMLGANVTQGYGTLNASNYNQNRSSMSISSTRHYAPKFNSDNHSKIEVEANVDLGRLENGTLKMVSLLQKIADNTKEAARNKGASHTTINNIHETNNNTGYGRVDMVSKDERQKVQAGVNRQKVNNNQVDKMRQLHNLIAKSPRAY